MAATIKHEFMTAIGHQIEQGGRRGHPARANDAIKHRTCRGGNSL